LFPQKPKKKNQTINIKTYIEHIFPNYRIHFHASNGWKILSAHLCAHFGLFHVAKWRREFVEFAETIGAAAAFRVFTLNALGTGLCEARSQFVENILKDHFQISIALQIAIFWKVKCLNRNALNSDKNLNFCFSALFYSDEKIFFFSFDNRIKFYIFHLFSSWPNNHFISHTFLR
jgi:hypothetical protein